MTSNTLDRINKRLRREISITDFFALAHTFKLYRTEKITKKEIIKICKNLRLDNFEIIAVLQKLDEQKKEKI